MALKGTNRRNFLKASAFSGIMYGSTASNAALLEQTAAAARRPNIVLYCCDQMRSDFVGAYRENATTKTPNIDSLVARGAAFRNAVTNQPLCSPSRACMVTGRYALETGEWRIAVGMDTSLPTLATELRKSGYTTNFIGKWHLMKADSRTKAGFGYVPPDQRHGFLDLWEGANEFEHTTHPYYGTIWDQDGKEITYKDQYRVDFITERAVRFLRRPQEKPFLLFISQLEPHHQNDENRVVAPRGYAERFKNPTVPASERGLPGDWQDQLPDYYGCIQKIDESVGTVLKTLKEQNLLDNTIFAFISDHGCQFKTRNTEYKRSPHDSSIRIPFIFQGPGFNGPTLREEIAGMIDLTPTLLAAAGTPVPASMKGKNLLPLLAPSQSAPAWDNVAYIQISESMVGRAIRTPEWCYCVADRTKVGTEASGSMHYEEYQMYNLCDDPMQQVNLAGRQEYREQAAMLRALLKKHMVEAGEPEAEIAPARLYP